MLQALRISTPTMSMRDSTPLSVSRSPSPDAMPKNFHSKTEWDYWKETIKELYINRNMTLSRLRLHMSQEHGFHAEDHEYKRRLHQWRLRKNYKAAEKELFAQHLDNIRAQQQPVSEPEFRFNDMLPLRIDKIERHRKASRRKSNKAIAFDVKASVSPEPEFAMSMRTNPQLDLEESHHQHQMLTPSLPTYAFPIDHSDASLWDVDHFDTSQTQPTSMMSAPLVPSQHQDRMDITMFNIVKAVDVFGAGDPQSATQTLDECCKSIKDLLQTDTWNFMMYMTVIQTLPVWNRAPCRELYQHLYSFFAGMSYSVLGRRHPVTEYLRTAANFDARQATLERACLLVLELRAQRSAAAHPQTKYSGGFPVDRAGALEFRLLESDRSDPSSRSTRGRNGPALDRKVDEMARLLREGWYLQSQTLEDVAVVMSKLKRSIEDYVRRAVDSLSSPSTEDDPWQSRMSSNVITASMMSMSATAMATPRYMDPQPLPHSQPQPHSMMMRTSMSDPRHFDSRRGR